MVRELAIAEIFRVGEVWRSPRGALYRVMDRSGRQVTLRSGIAGDGRAVKRDWDAVIEWVRPPELNEAAS